MNWLVLILLLLAAPAWGMEHYSQPLQDQSGRAITNASVTVYLTGTTTKATIYSDNGTTTKSNPFTSGATSGVVSFYAANGAYDLVYAKVGYTFTAADSARIVLFDEEDFDGGSGSGASTFDELGGGTNTIASMVVGTGGSLSYTNSGVINASQFRGNTTVAFANGGTGLTSASDDTVIVSSGSAWVATAIPDCDNATSSKLLYDTSTNAFSCGTDQSAGGGTTFDTIGSGTNTTMAAIVSTGGSLVPGGTGLLAANVLRPTVTTASSSYTILATDFEVLCNTVAAARVLTLPSAASKAYFRIKNLGTNSCTINRAGSDLIDGGTTAILTTQYEAVDLVSDGSTNWEVH